MRRLTESLFFNVAIAVCAGAFVAEPVLFGQGAIVPVTLANTLARNDDGSTGAVPLGIGGDGGINFFGQNFTSVYVNNNGNLTFNYSFGTYTPNGLATGVGQPIIAPFFADVDTNPGGSPVMYGNATVNGFNAFVVNYVNVAYYASADKLNSFQVILIDRSDTGAGNFDIEYNYNQIHWETGSASGGSDGLGGNMTSAAVGYSNGQSGANNVYFQLPGSLMPGSFIDGGPLALVSHSLNSTVLGRYVFQVRNGSVMVTPGPTTAPLMVTGNNNLGTIPLGTAVSATIGVSGGVPPYTISGVGTPPPGVFVTGGGISGTPTQPGNYNVIIAVTDSTGASQSVSITFSVFGFTSLNLPPGITGSPYYGAVGVSGGTPPYYFTVSGLPRGLTANTSGGISGLVNSPATIPVTVTATEGSGVSVSGTLTLVFSAPPPLLVPATTLPAGMVSAIYSQALTATGGAPPYTFSLSSGSLPQGLSLRSTGTIAGIPAQSGSFAFGVRATDYTGASAVGAVSLTISPPTLTLLPSSGALSSGVATFEYPGQTLGATGGTGPYKFAVTSGSLPAGLTLSSGGMISGTPTSPGTASFTVTVTDSTGVTGTGALSIVVRPSSTDLLISTGSLTFSLPAGTAALPSAQQIAVQSTSISTPLNYSVAVTPASATWLTVSPSGGATPGTLSVSLNSQAMALAASTTPYSATVNVTCLSPAPCAGYAQSVSVNLTVTNVPPMLSLSSSLLSFNTPAGAPQGSSQTLGLTNAGGGSIGISSVTCADAWCSVSGVPGSIGAGMTSNLTVNVGAAGLSAGFYRTTVTVTSSVGVYVVPVTLFIAGASSMAVEPAGAQYQVVPGGTPNGADTSFTVNTNSSTAVSYTVAASSNANWLTLSSTGGTASAAQPGTVSFSFNQSVIAGLAPQAYYATITVSSPGLVNSPQMFEVVLNVLPPTAPQRPTPSPAGLLFITSAATAPPSQNVSVSTSSASSTVFQTSTSTQSGGNWLLASPVEGNAAPGAPAVTSVSVNPVNLQPGTYTGGVNFAFGTAGVRTVNVTLIVTPAATSAHDGITSKAPGCTPAKLVPVQTELLGNFAAPVAWPTPLSIMLVDDCGNNLTNGQIVATFSNGDPPVVLSLSNPTTGAYAGTWTPRNSSAQVTVNARASAPGLPNAVAQIAGSVTPNAAPVLSANSTLHLYNPQVGAALAPGNLVTISGSGLSVTNATAPAGAPLPTTLNGTQVIVGGTAVPLLSVSPTSLTAQVPYELTTGMQYQVLVNTNGALTTPDMIQLANTSPGVSTAAAGLLTAYHSNGSAVTEAAPAAPGESIYLLGAGLGATDIPVADGAISPSMPPANALDQPSVTVNNEQATVTFAGLQPGTVGIYQVTFTVPMDAVNGDLNVVLSQDGVAGNTAVLPVKKSS